MFLIVGLGNPGREYENTRHNMGFLFLDFFAPEINAGPEQSRFQGIVQKGRLNNHDVILLKPQTFMNLSGASVLECMQFFKIPPENIIVVFDDIDQEFAAVRTRFGGGHGGHNGVRDILARLGTDQFHRLKLGIGRPAHKSAVVGWVLGKLTAQESETLHASFVVARERLQALVTQRTKSGKNS
jgi:PTH1 family peptidyl-tRNA hydrolase